MSKKIDVDSCDTLSDHVNQAILIYPELKKLHSQSIIHKDVMEFVKNTCAQSDKQRPVIVVTATVSECFDVTCLLTQLLGTDKVCAAYPHTVQQEALNQLVIVAPLVTFQLTSPLAERMINCSSLIVIANADELSFISNVLGQLLNQLSEDCKVFALQGFAKVDDIKDVSVVSIPEPKKVKTQPKQRQMIIEVEDEPVVVKEPVLELIIEPLSEDEDSVGFHVESQIDNPVYESNDSNDDEITSVESLDEHHIVMVDRNYKRSYLRNRLRGSSKKTLIITRTRHNAHRLEEYLYQGKVRSRILHANLSEEAKDKVIERFVSGDLSVLLLPEAVAQTIDLNNVDDILFFDLPDVGVEFKDRITLIGERFNVNNTSSIVTLDETPWIEAMESELKWVLPKISVAQPQRTHNILRIKNRNTVTKEKPEKTEKRVGRGLRKLGGKNNSQQKKRTNTFPPKVEKDNFNDHDAQPNFAEDPFNSINQSIVNENRNPFAFDSFEASVSRQNKQRVKQMFSRKDKPQKEVQNDFNAPRAEKKNVKIVHRKKRTFDIDGNQ